jgi:hypothetical protein
VEHPELSRMAWRLTWQLQSFDAKSGNDVDANRRLATQIESAVGPCLRGVPHIKQAGPHALPHFQQQPRIPPPPRGHAFYETARRKARRQKP